MQTQGGDFCISFVKKNVDHLSTQIKIDSTDKQMCIRIASFTKTTTKKSRITEVSTTQTTKITQRGNSQDRTLATEYTACSRGAQGPHLADENRTLPDEFSVKTVSVWPPTDCMVKLCSRGADTVFFSKLSITVSSSFKVKDTCREFDSVRRFYF